MRIQAITRNNGYGLSKDITVLQEALVGHVVEFTDWQRPRNKGHWDWNFHLELVNPTQLRTATVNAFVPNPEWFDPKWMPHLKSFDIVLAKTRDCEGIFKELHHNVVYTGWTSPDPGYTVDYSRPALVHVAGKSIMKGTQQLIEAMRLVDVSLDLVVDRKTNAPANIRQHILPNNEVLAAMKRSPIHVQPSTYEGFGHVLNEARAMGAITITTDARPMCEVSEAEYTILCPVSHDRIKGLAMESVPDIASLADCIRIAVDALVHGPKLGALARAAYERDRAAFHERINALVK